MALEGIFATPALTPAIGAPWQTTAVYGMPLLNKGMFTATPNGGGYILVDQVQTEQAAAERILPPPLSYAGVLFGLLQFPDSPSPGVPSTPLPAEPNQTKPLMMSQMTPSTTPSPSHHIYHQSQFQAMHTAMQLQLS